MCTVADRHGLKVLQEAAQSKESLLSVMRVIHEAFIHRQFETMKCTYKWLNASFDLHVQLTFSKYKVNIDNQRWRSVSKRGGLRFAHYTQAKRIPLLKFL